VATIAAVVLILTVLAGAFLVELSRSGTVKSQLGTTTFLAGRTRDYAPQIAEEGPILLPDPLGKSRNVYVQHLGPDPQLGWVTILAVPPGDQSRCVLRWSQGDRRFHDPCTGRTYGADGTGLIRYPATALPSGRLRVDLRAPLPPTYTVTTGTAPPPSTR
jgi:hypothetical protein